MTVPHHETDHPTLAGRVAIITGAASGLGLATAGRMAARGAIVVLTDHARGHGAILAEDLRRTGHAASFVPLDVTDEPGWQRLIERVMNDHGRLDVMVNNAGVYFQERIEDMTLGQWRALSEINLDGVFLGTKYAILAMKGRGEDEPFGSIVNISSVAGMVGGAFASCYHMSKGGVRLFTKSAALECGQLGYRIRVNSVHPGLTETPMKIRLAEEAVRVGGRDSVDAVLGALLKQFPLGRFGKPDDIARAVCFLASDDSEYMTGSELVVDGGFTAR